MFAYFVDNRFFLDAVVLSQLALNISYQRVVHVDSIGVLSINITFVFATFTFRPTYILSSGISCSMCCNYCGVTMLCSSRYVCVVTAWSLSLNCE